MIDATKTIERARRKLGAPIIDVELTDEQMTSLIKDARETFYLYAKISDMSPAKMDCTEDAWIKKYFYALCKETLGRVRSKFNRNLSVPGNELAFDYENLLAEAGAEKRFLKYAIFGEKDILKIENNTNAILAVYINTGNLISLELEDYMKSIQDRMTTPKGFTTYFLPVQSESRIECIYPVSAELDEEGKHVINRLSDRLNELSGIKINKDEQ